jgi:hypothetical protein
MRDVVLVGSEKGLVKLRQSCWGTVGKIVCTSGLISTFSYNLRLGKLTLRDEMKTYLIMSAIVCNFYILKME